MYEYDDYSLCDGCNVREYCDDAEDCIQDSLYWISEEGDIITVDNWEEKLKRLEVEFKKKKNYRKVR